jgi:hydroxymethylpyrimidine pyrophosphatase-like HAD family hydrolase
MNLPIKLLSTDFDGTVFAEFENPPIPEELQELIARVQTGGGRWVINTGRDLSSLMEALARSGISVEPDYLVLVEREIHEHRDSRYLSLEPWNTHCHESHAQLFAKVNAHLPELVSWISSRFHAHIYADAYSPLCIIAGNNGDMDVIHTYLDEFCLRVPHLAVVRNDVYARFCHHDFNKGTALAEIARRLGIDRAAIFAAGDHLNDLPMLSPKYARYLAAPANAVPEVQAVMRTQGGYLSTRPHGQGVAEALRHFLASGA